MMGGTNIATDIAPNHAAVQASEADAHSCGGISEQYMLRNNWPVLLFKTVLYCDNYDPTLHTNSLASAWNCSYRRI